LVQYTDGVMLQGRGEWVDTGASSRSWWVTVRNDHGRYSQPNHWLDH